MPDLPVTTRRKRAWKRQQRLRELGYDNYSTYLLSPAWSTVKARYRESDRPQHCQCGETRVQYHHLTYERVGGNELPADLIALCRLCHEMQHELERRGVATLDPATLTNAERAAEYREQQAANTRWKEARRQMFDDLPLHRRVRLLTAAAHSNAKGIDNDLRVIRHIVSRAESKLKPSDMMRMDRRAREAADKLFAVHPDDLAAMSDEELAA